MLTVKRR